MGSVFRAFQVNYLPGQGPLPQPSAPSAPLISSPSANLPPDPVAAMQNGCPDYGSQFSYKSYRVPNPNGLGGNFAVDTETIRTGYWWKVVAASAHVESTSQWFLAWYLCPESDRNRPPTQNVGPANSTPQSTGIVLMGPIQLPNTSNYGYAVAQAMESGLPICPLVIPNRFFLRVALLQSNNSPAAGVVMEMRIAYIELPVNDPGPVLE